MKKTALRRVSKHRAVGLVKYNKAKKEYLDAHMACERCHRYSVTQLHHRKGRTGSLLWDKRYFAALCEQCHNFIHRNPTIAFETGWMVDRLT